VWHAARCSRAGRAQGEATRKLEEARAERDFLKELNGSLLRNQAELRQGLAENQAALAQSQASVTDLKEQVRRAAAARMAGCLHGCRWHRRRSMLT